MSGPGAVPGAHQSVLLEETVQHLMAIRGERLVFVDGTYGRGGHSRALLEHLEADDRLIVIDRDPEAIVDARSLAGADHRVTVCHGVFSELPRLLEEAGVSCADGVLFDLGVSSPQLDSAERGFSFLREGPLDMRMDPGRGVSAAQWLNTAPVDEIAEVLKTLGEERFARRIARAVVASRPLYSTVALADVIEAAQPAGARERGKHPATRSFQAIRMYINSELGELEQGIDAAFAHLCPGGRLAVISFHSLEDRLVKRQFRRLASPPPLPRRLPVRGAGDAPAARIVAGPVRASDSEVAANPRARSATLRVLERVA